MKGTKIIALASLRAKRLRLEAKVKEHKSEERTLTDSIVEDMRLENIESATAGKATFSFESKDMPQVVDWEVLYKYISRTKRFELLQRRVHEGNWRDLIEEGKTPPGIEAAPIFKTYLYVKA